jgi:hypothetical protein
MLLNEKVLRRLIKESLREQLYLIEMKKHIISLNDYVEKTNNLIEVLNEANYSEGVQISSKPTAAQRLQALKALASGDYDPGEPEFIFDDPDIEQTPEVGLKDLKGLEVLEFPDSAELRDKGFDFAATGKGRLQVNLSDKSVEKLAPIASGLIKLMPGIGIFGDLVGGIVAKKVLKPLLEKGLSSVDTLKAIEKLVKTGAMKSKALKAGEGFLKSLEYVEVLQNTGKYSQEIIKAALERQKALGSKNDKIAQAAYNYIKKNKPTALELGERYLVLSIINTLNQPAIQDLIKAASGLASIKPAKRKAAVKKIAQIAMKPVKTPKKNDNKSAEELILDMEQLDDLYKIVAGVAVTEIEDDYVVDDLSISGEKTGGVPLESGGVEVPGMIHYSEIDIDELDPDDPTDAKIIDLLIKQLETERTGGRAYDVARPGRGMSVDGYDPEDVIDGLKFIADKVKDTTENVEDIFNDVDDPEAFIDLPEPLSTEELLALAAEGDQMAINALVQIYSQEKGKKSKVDLPAGEEIGVIDLPEPEPEDPESVPIPAKVKRVTRPLRPINR